MLRTWKQKSKREKGIAVLMTAGLMFLIVPVAGLAVDGGIAYVLKTRLSSATDAAALAAARSLNVGLTLAEQEAEARARALDFFEANFKEGSYGTRNLSVTAAVAETEAKTRSVTVTAAFDAPQYFMRLLGFDKIRIGALGRASRRDVNLILVLDKSGSMGDYTDDNSPCAKMKEAAKYFTDLFAESRDRLGMITYGSTAFRAFAPTMNFKTASPNLVDTIDTITCNGGTSTGMAMQQAWDEIPAIDEEGALNVILLFTDGYANAVTADYPVRTRTDTRYGGSSGYKTWVAGSPGSFSGGSVCTSTSPCRDAEGDRWDRNNGQTNRNYTAPNWNPNWTPGAIRGVLTQAANDHNDVATGSTWGIIRHTTTSITAADVIVPSNGCAFSTASFLSNNGNNGGPTLVRRDIAYMPDEDIYGNSTDGYKNIATYAAGPYIGEKRIDRPMDVTAAGFNVTDNLARTIRENATYSPVIYVIGLGDVDHVLLRRVANDPASPIYNEDLRDGLYVYAPDQNKLKDAFARIAGEILRISL